MFIPDWARRINFRRDFQGLTKSLFALSPCKPWYGWCCDKSENIKIKLSSVDILRVRPSSARIDSLRRRANAGNISFRISLRWSIPLSTQLIKPNYLVILPTEPAPKFLQLETYPFYRQLNCWKIHLLPYSKRSAHFLMSINQSMKFI